MIDIAIENPLQDDVRVLIAALNDTLLSRATMALQLPAGP
jgi:hypothetical protein